MDYIEILSWESYSKGSHASNVFIKTFECLETGLQMSAVLCIDLG